MHKNIPVADVEIDEDVGHITDVRTVFNVAHAPVQSVRNDRLDASVLKKWWDGRSIPASREGLERALESVGVATAQLLLKKSYGLSLSDQYWICPSTQSLKWKDINFFDNNFSEDVGNLLLGYIGARDNSASLNLLSPDNSSDGQLKKAWKIIDGERYLIKEGNPYTFQETFNEVIASNVCDRLGIEHTRYTILKLQNKFYSVCPNFITPNIELISASQIFAANKRPVDVSEYEHYIACVEKLGIKDIRSKLEQMIVLDFIISNQDRHFNNFGLIRNAETLEWVGVAPIFDCGASLGYLNVTVYQDEINKCRSFAATHSNQIKLVQDFSWLDLSKLDGIENEFAELLSQIPEKNMPKERKDTLCNLLRQRISELENFTKSR
jgi:hypothetical protein